MTCHNMALVLRRLRITIGDGIHHETCKHQFFWESMKPNGGGELSGSCGNTIWLLLGLAYM
ncbi:hypothetical protein KY284_012918 [Solanum tuberosum]|nr:hypothetical protein KY284_012918 [Solanum tuberosum]